jgi:polynucleotide 5'-kinase involved in rRNA processing
MIHEVNDTVERGLLDDLNGFSLSEAVNYLSEKVRLYGPTAYLSLERYYDDNDTLDIVITREETESEKEYRLKREERARELEYRAYQKLKQKFERQ